MTKHCWPRCVGRFMGLLWLACLLMLTSDSVGLECLCWAVGLFANNSGRYWIICFGFSQGGVCWAQR